MWWPFKKKQEAKQAHKLVIKTSYSTWHLNLAEAKSGDEAVKEVYAMLHDQPPKQFIVIHGILLRVKDVREVVWQRQ